MYASLGLSAIGFVIHAIVLYDWEVANRKLGLGWMGLMALLNFLGVIPYATRVSLLDSYAVHVPFSTKNRLRIR